MKKLLSTNSNNWGALIARLALGITLFPHGAQKLLGWFGGDGFSNTIGFFTGEMHLPFIIALLVILIEFFGSLLMILGLFTRISAFAIFVTFLGVLFSGHINNGFFMNWGMQANKGEGFEYFILLFGLVITALISGGGKASIDAAIVKNTNK
ncbi:MAG: DoxX family protein [Ferruginibacter sp.]